MITNNARLVMRRKAGEGRPPPEIDEMSPPRAWRAAIPRAAQAAARVHATMLDLNEERVLRDALGELVAQGALITITEGPDETFGVAIIDPPILAGLIEALTSGRIASRAAATPRPPTRTDAVICADFIDAMLEQFDNHLQTMEEVPPLVGYRYAAPIGDTRALAMTMADGPYSVFRIELELANGAKQGRVTFAFPAAPRTGSRRRDSVAFAQALQANLMGVSTRLDATLHKMRLSLAEITEWQAGDVLQIPLLALSTVALETSDGQALAQATLGQQGGFRALKIVRLAGEEAPETADRFEEEAAPAALPPALDGEIDVGEVELADLSVEGELEGS